MLLTGIPSIIAECSFNSWTKESTLGEWYVWAFAGVGALSLLFLAVKIFQHSKKLGSKK